MFHLRESASLRLTACSAWCGCHYEALLPSHSLKISFCDIKAYCEVVIASWLVAVVAVCSTYLPLGPYAGILLKLPAFYPPFCQNTCLNHTKGLRKGNIDALH